MRVLRRISQLGTVLAVAAVGLSVAAPSAQAVAAPALGTTSLASVLTADGNKFDRNWHDYDIVTEAVLAVLAAKPTSAVGVLADGTVPLTAFIPNDRAFQWLVHDLTGKWLGSERDVFAAVAGLGIPTVETVLLYHVVPGATITAAQAVKADGAKLTTAQGGVITVNVRKHPLQIRLWDLDPTDLNPTVVQVNLNKGNRQIAHGISRVLRPLDL